jgi:hypothetical protein
MTPTPLKKRSMSRSWTANCTTIWILLSTGFSAGAMLLSAFSSLNHPGNMAILTLGLVGATWGYVKLNRNPFCFQGLRWRRFRKPFPLLYLLSVMAALVGGAIHPPNNHDALSYRIPRLLHWLSTGQWHYIGGADTRMDFSGTGFEAMMLPPFAAFHTLRFAFLINVACYLLLPGLIFLVFSALGVRRSISARWMWIIPCASCFAMEAGSIGNDLPVCVYVLAALFFGLRAIETGRWTDVVLAVLASALMTGVKVAGLPLLLPITICMLRVFFKHPKLIFPATATAILATTISFLPIAISNTLNAGDWAGDANSLLKIHDPVVGLAGNAMIIGSASLAPAIFPQAEKLNIWFNGTIAEGSLSWIKAGFADFRMTHPQLASEETSGLGLGVSAALVLGVAGAWRQLRIRRLVSPGGLIFGSFWFALLFFMIKLGNCGAPRLIAPYYVGLIGLPLLLIQTCKVFKKKWWRWSSLVLLLPILPALAMSPARPLLPMRTLVGTLRDHGINHAMLSRMDRVYEVYANRHDAYGPVRDLLPENTTSIGFAGTSGESQYSFWLPMGTRRVIDFTPGRNRELPDTSNLDAIVASSWGTNDRFGMTPRQLADLLNWEIIGSIPIRSLASSDAIEWSVLVPTGRTENTH